VLLCSVVFNIPRLIRFSPLYNYLGEDPTFLQVSYVVDMSCDNVSPIDVSLNDSSWTMRQLNDASIGRCIN
jgi:hypothetical protein